MIIAKEKNNICMYSSFEMKVKINNKIAIRVNLSNSKFQNFQNYNNRRKLSLKQRKRLNLILNESPQKQNLPFVIQKDEVCIFYIKTMHLMSIYSWRRIP